MLLNLIYKALNLKKSINHKNLRTNCYLKVFHDKSITCIKTKTFKIVSDEHKLQKKHMDTVIKLG